MTADITVKIGFHNNYISIREGEISMSDDIKRLIVVLQSKGLIITTEDMEYIAGVISENEWLGFDEDAENDR